MTSVGEQWVAAIAARDRASLTALLADEVDFRGLTPRKVSQATTPVGGPGVVLGIGFRVRPAGEPDGPETTGPRGRHRPRGGVEFAVMTRFDAIPE